MFIISPQIQLHIRKYGSIDAVPPPEEEEDAVHTHAHVSWVPNTEVQKPELRGLHELLQCVLLICLCSPTQAELFDATKLHQVPIHASNL